MSTTKTHPLSKRIQRMAESATLKMAQLARDLRAQGKDVISLSIGEPDFDTPEHIKAAAIDALQKGYTKYTPVPGLPELRKSIVNKFKRDNDLDFEINQIVVSNGAKQSIANLSLALLDEGDEVIIFAPYWVSTKIVLFSSPCNPTGSVYTKEELKGIADVIAKHEDIYIIADEIYEYINFTGKHCSIGSFENVKDRTVTVNGFSKGFAMTGWRLGYIGAPQWIAAACSKIQGQFTSGANAFSQMAGAHALATDLTPTMEMKAEYLKRRELVKKLLKEIPGFKVNDPQGAFYIFPEISSYFGTSYENYTINNADDFCEYILQEGLVAVVTGTAFGADDCFRISYAASEEQLIKCMKRIKEACSKLK